MTTSKNTSKEVAALEVLSRFSSPFEVAIQCGLDTMIPLLMESGFCINAIGSSEDTLLILAARCANPEVFATVLQIVQEKNIDMNAKNKEGLSAIDMIKQRPVCEGREQLLGMLEAVIARQELLKHCPLVTPVKGDETPPRVARLKI